MGQKSKIQWTEATYNPWHGCKKVSDGCKYCYMYRDKERYGQDPTTVLKSKTNFRAPLKWKEPKLIFTCSWSDFFIKEADEWRPEVWEIIKNTPQHTYQILTKRPERMAECLPDDWGDGYPNVWLGVSVENQKVIDSRIAPLVGTPAAVRFLSCEPLLSSIDISKWLVLIDWVIIGGESGNENGKYRYRPCDISWIQNICAQCLHEQVPIFVKQLGSHIAKEKGLKDRFGGNVDEFIPNIRFRQMPEYYESN